MVAYSTSAQDFQTICPIELKFGSNNFCLLCFNLVIKHLLLIGFHENIVALLAAILAAVSSDRQNFKDSHFTDHQVSSLAPDLSYALIYEK